MEAGRLLRRRAKLNKWLEQIREDRVIILLCLGLALSFWVPAKMSKRYRLEKNVTIHCTVPDEYAFSLAPPSDMSVVLEGSGWDLLFEQFKNPRLSLPFNLTNSRSVSLNRAQLQKSIRDRLSSYDLSIVEMSHEGLYLDLERRKGKWLPLCFNGSIAFMPDYYLTRPIYFEPDKVWVEGPESQIDLTQCVEAGSKHYKNRSSPISEVIPLTLPPEFRSTTRQVVLHAEIEQFTEKSVFVPVTITQKNTRVQVFPEQVKVTFQVALSRFDKVGSADFAVSVMPVGVSAVETEAVVQLTKKPEGVHHVRVFPSRIDYLIIEE